MTKKVITLFFGGGYGVGIRIECQRDPGSLWDFGKASNRFLVLQGWNHQIHIPKEVSELLQLPGHIMTVKGVTEPMGRDGHILVDEGHVPSGTASQVTGLNALQLTTDDGHSHADLSAWTCSAMSWVLS
jgi:hypothetical protein